MTTANASATSFIPVGEGVRSKRGRRNLILGLATVAVVAVGLAAIQYARTSAEVAPAAPTSPLADSMQVRDVYAPGGSVYDSQVPAAAISDLAPYAPGGSVYTSQVPDGTLVRDLSAYAPGGSVYDSQVPGQ